MQRRKGSGIYEFRKRLPSGLAGRPAPAWLKTHPDLAILVNPQSGHFKRELTVSLGTNDTKLARRRDIAEAKRAHDLFDLAVELMANGGKASLSPERPRPELSLEAIRLWIIGRVLAEDEMERDHGDARRHHQTQAERAQWPDLLDARLADWGMADGHLEAKDVEIAILRGDFKKALSQHRIDIVKPELHAYLTENGIQIDPRSPEYRKAGMALLRGYVKAYDLLEARQRGDDVPTPDAPAAPLNKGPFLSDAFTQWRKGGTARGAKQPGANAVVEAERTVRYFTDWHGDLPLGDITKALVRDFRDNGLSKIGTRLPLKVRVLPLRKLVAAKEAAQSEPIHAASINKYLNLLSAICNTAERDGLLDDVKGFSNPFSKMGVRLDERAERTKRLPFSATQLSQLFADKVFTERYRPRAGGGEACFWFPLIGLLTGARLNEITQLRIDDIRKDPETGIWFLDINGEAGKSIKTASSRREVPLHAELIRLGLLDYRDAILKRRGAKATNRLFPGVQSEDGVYSATAFTKWFGRYLRDSIGITDKSTVFHSFRHTFKDACRNAGLSEELHDALTGHSGSSGSVGRGYGSGFGLKALHDGVSKIAVPDSVKKVPAWRPLRNNGL